MAPPRRSTDNSADRESSCERLRLLETAILALTNRATTNTQSTFDRFNKHHPPTYEGTADPIILESWLREIEKLFNATGCPEDEKVAIGTYYLKNEADNWWNMVKANCLATPGFGWEQFSAKLKDRFYPEELRWSKKQEFLALTQDALSVQDFTNKFTELSRFATTVIPTEEERVKMYIRKLSPRVRVPVMCSGATTFQRAYETALGVYAANQEEDAAKRALFAKRSHSSSYANHPAKKAKFTPAKKSTAPSSGPRKCFKCQKDWHPGKNCDGTPIKCYICGKEGHRAFTCSKNPNAGGPSNAPVRNRVYNMLETEEDPEAEVIAGTVLVNSLPAYVLFDTGASVSFVSSSFIEKSKLHSSVTVNSVISLPNGEKIACNRAFEAFLLLLVKQN